MGGASENHVPGSAPNHPRKKRRSARAARDAILDAAEAILAREGIDRVLLKPVAEAAGITHSGVLHHFRSRTGLLEALFQRSSARMRSEILALFDQLHPGMGMDDAVELLVELYARVTDPSRAPILAWLIASGGDPLPTAEAFGLAEITERVHRLRTQVESRAELDDTRFRVELIVLAMFGDLMVGASTRERLGVGDTARARRRFRERLAHLLLEGVVPS